MWEWLREQWETGRAWELLIAFGLGAACMVLLFILIEFVA